MKTVVRSLTTLVLVYALLAGQAPPRLLASPPGADRAAAGRPALEAHDRAPAAQAGAPASDAGVVRLTDNEAFDGLPAWSPDGGRIAFTSKRNGNSEIYVMNADGTGVSRLTDDEAYDGSPAWSPDGGRIAFSSNRNGNSEIYVMNADGTGVVRLTDNEANVGLPAWSPDGGRIAFSSKRDGNSEIYVMNADGTGVVRLTDNEANDGLPAWSPDGGRIAFQSDRDGTWDIYVMNADGTGVVRLTPDGANDRVPAWSPDGGRIAFYSGRDGNYEIYVMNADGTGVVRLTDDEAFDGSPAWSPDGGRIAFTSARNGDAEIYVMNVADTGASAPQSQAGADRAAADRPALEGHDRAPAAQAGAPVSNAGVVRLTDDIADDYAPAWSPDGGRIAFVSERNGNRDIYVMNADGTGVVRLTDNDADDYAPAWSSDGGRIAFVSERNGNREIYVMNVAGGVTAGGVTAGGVAGSVAAGRAEGERSGLGVPELSVRSTTGSLVTLTWTEADAASGYELERCSHNEELAHAIEDGLELLAEGSLHKKTALIGKKITLIGKLLTGKLLIAKAGAAKGAALGGVGGAAAGGVGAVPGAVIGAVVGFVIAYAAVSAIYHFTPVCLGEGRIIAGGEGELTANGYSDGGVTSGERYWWRVRARDADGGVGEWSNTVRLRPGAPTLEVTDLTDGSVRLSWTSLEGVIGYEVEACQPWRRVRRSLQCTTHSYAASVSEDAYAGLERGRTHEYRVRLRDESGRAGRWSDRVDVTPGIPFHRPELSVERVSASEVRFSWSEVDYAAVYALQRMWMNEGGELQAEAIVDGLTGTEYVYEEEGEGSYYYVVQARNEIGEGPRSNQVVSP